MLVTIAYSRHAAAVVLGVILLLPSPKVEADEPSVPLPLWEIGVGAVARMSTAYPGAESNSTSLTPLPYLKYRGRFIELGGDETLRLVPFRTDRFELGLSFDGSSRVDNRETALGGEQPDLNALMELGPEFIFRVAERPAFAGSDNTGRIELVFQTRGVFSVDDGVRYEGALIRPALRYRQNGTMRPGSRLQASIGPIFATEGVQDVFYESAPGPGERGFDASGGYLGTELKAAIRYPLTSRLQAVSGFALSYLGGSVNENSPLMRSNWDATVFLGFTVSLFQSEARASRDR